MKEFNDYIQKVTALKDKIENEITEIDKLYDDINKKIKKSFEQKHEKLIKEENDLREKLQNEVTKVKEKLEKCFSDSNTLIKTGEKINKGIKNLEKEEKNIIKTLSYVSKINKNQKEMKTLVSELMKSLKISYKEEENNIKFETFWFNGITPPTNIEFKDIGSNSFKILWSDSNIKLNIDKQKLTFKVEIRKEQQQEIFNIYSKNEECLVLEKLEQNTGYEIRICSIYNNICSNWTQIHKIRTTVLDSKILTETKRENEFIQKLLEWSGGKKMELLYRGTRDGMNCNSFHNKCDNQGANICLFKNDKGYIFGGYSSVSWNNEGGYSSVPDSFIFTLTNIYNIEPTKFPNTNTTYSVFMSNKQGPTFGGGHDINICSNFTNDKPYCNFPHSFNDVLGKGKSIFTGDISNINKYFILKEIEVFKIIK